MTPPRLHVLTATGSPAALVLRRGPSGVVATIGWDRESHEFTPGQRLKGRIYEYRADISSRYALGAPDGTRTDRPDWEWANLWGGRLQFAARGALYETEPGGEAQRLRDLSGLAFEAVEAPYEGVVA